MKTYNNDWERADNTKRLRTESKDNKDKVRIFGKKGQNENKQQRQSEDRQ